MLFVADQNPSLPDATRPDELKLVSASKRLASGPDMAARTALNISPEKRAKIEELLRKGTGIVRAAIDTSSGAATVALIRDQLIEREPELFKKHMAGTLHRIANKTAAVIEKSVDNMVEEGVKPNQVPGLSVALGIILDKQAALAGDPQVSVVEHRVSLDAASVRAMLSSQNGTKQAEPIEAEVVNIA